MPPIIFNVTQNVLDRFIEALSSHYGCDPTLEAVRQAQIREWQQVIKSYEEQKAESALPRVSPPNIG